MEEAAERDAKGVAQRADRRDRGERGGRGGGRGLLFGQLAHGIERELVS